MKKTLFIVLLIIPFLGFSQTTKPIEGFLGIKFGRSKADVISALAAKGMPLKTLDTTKNLLIFENVKLGPRDAHVFGVRFFNNQAYFATFIFTPDAEPKTIEYYNGLVSDLTEIYGPGKSTKVFRTTFTDGDGYEITAIQTGNADYYTIWTSNTNEIQAVINMKLNVILNYYDGVIKAAADAQQKAKEKGDY
jgi:hypothetical protein